jgi:hypothetical protein
MSDTSQGPGWWQASDGKWYPPEQAPGAAPQPSQQPSGARLDVGAALSWAWGKFVANIGQIVLITVIIFAASAILQAIGYGVRLSINSFFLSNLLHFGFWSLAILVTLVLQAGLIRMALAVTRGQQFDAGILFKFDNIAPYIVGSIVVTLLSFVGLIFCCIGYFIVALFTLFYGYFIFDRQSQPMDSIKQSFDLVSKNAGDVLVFAIIIVLINAVTCGLLIGFTTLAVGYAYRTLNNEPVAA